jgi:hypothetical protein
MRFVWLVLCRFAVISLLLCGVFWLLLQQYVAYQVQQQLVLLNEQYRFYATQQGWPLVQLKAGSSRFTPWLNLLEIQQLELRLPNDVALLVLTDLKFSGLLPVTLVTATPTTVPALRYQLSWQQLAVNPALQLLLPAELRQVIQPVAGVVHWQVQDGPGSSQQLDSQIRLQMAEQLLLQSKVQLHRVPATTGTLPAQLQLHSISLKVQQQLLPALQPWLSKQGFLSASMLFEHGQHQLARCSLLPAPLKQAFLAWQQQQEQLRLHWQPQPALSLLQWPEWGCVSP